MLTSFLISQLFVGAALICNLLSFQFKKRRGVVIALTLSTVFVAAQLYFLGQITAMYLTLYAILFWVVAIFTTNKKLLWLFVAGAVALFLATYSSWLDYLVLGSVLLALFSIYNDDQKQMRELQMVGTFTRIPYYVFVFSPVGLLLEAALLISNLVGYYRFYIKKQ